MKKDADTKEDEQDAEGEAFLISMLVGAFSDNAALGGLVGGSLVGGVFGDFVQDGELF